MQFNVKPLDEIDFYKAGHYAQYPVNTVEIFSNFTPRSSRTNADYVIVFGIQAVIKDIHENWKNNFFNLSKEEIIKELEEYKEFMDKTIYPDAVDVKHILDVHAVGYLPIEIMAIPEGFKVPVGVPVLTIRNTHPSAYWLVNYLETKLSNALWKPITSATTAFQYLQNFHGYASITGANLDFIPWAGHDFSYRGMSGDEDAVMSGMAHLTCFTGTDTVPAIKAAKYYGYGDWKKELIGGSVVATEHSVMCAGSKDGEFYTFERLLETFPTNVLSVVSDTWDYWQVITDYLPRLKDKIMARNGRLVIRPDSGDPVRIICGYRIVTDLSEGYCCNDGEDFVLLKTDSDGNETFIRHGWVDDGLFKGHEDVEVIPRHVALGTFRIMAEIFGYTVNEKGFKVLDPHIGLIYGDSITIKRQEAILTLLTEFGFTADNLVLGIGSFTYEYVTRDTYGMAMKATNIVTVIQNGESGELVSRAIYKDPKTQSGKSFSKKSARGYLKVEKSKNGEFVLVDNLQHLEETKENTIMKQSYCDGVICNNYSLAEIRNQIKTYLVNESI